MTLCIEAPDGSATRANLAVGEPVAVTLSRPTSYSTMQIKGIIASVQAPTSDDLDQVRTHADAFLAEVAQHGFSGTAAQRFVGTGTGLQTVVIDVTERYDQTPGPDAGRAL